uniref:Uncharacterized protein n=1 Tax=Anguilla anguilla TaxID=7936 RepID=A0A0E9W6I4_ANGAN
MMTGQRKGGEGHYGRRISINITGAYNHKDTHSLHMNTLSLSVNM